MKNVCWTWLINDIFTVVGTVDRVDSITATQQATSTWNDKNKHKSSTNELVEECVQQTGALLNAERLRRRFWRFGWTKVVRRRPTPAATSVRWCSLRRWIPSTCKPHHPSPDNRIKVQWQQHSSKNEMPWCAQLRILSHLRSRLNQHF